MSEPPRGATRKGCEVGQDPELISRGWEWRCNTDDNRARDLVENYEALGFEVLLAPIDLEGLDADCMGCLESLRQFHAVYVRRRRPGPSPDAAAPPETGAGTPPDPGRIP